MKTTILAAIAALAALPAFAHVSFEGTEAEAGGTWRAVLRVPHGCDGQGTQAIAITMPEGIFAVQPMPKPGWTLDTERGDYARSYDNHGTAEAAGLRRITWTGALPDAWYDEFVFRGMLAPDLAPGTVLYFPVEQTCANGTQSWSGIPAEGGAPAEKPAPAVTVKAGGQVHHH